ncbi:MAG: DrmE family protein [Lachnospira sp.]|nr:DrmE family protein [Lachnospira sp.]
MESNTIKWDRFEIVLDKEIITKEKIVRCLCDYYKSIDSYKFRGIVLHTGSICFDAVSYVYALMSNLILAEYVQEDFVSMLNKGDKVLRTLPNGKQIPYEFEKIDKVDGGKEDYIYLNEIGTTNRVMLPENKWNSIRIYYGDNDLSSRRGIRKRNNKITDFYKQVLELEDDRIPNSIETSSVLVMSKEEADYLTNNISIKFGDTIIPILDLVAVTYYTEGLEYSYRGNVAHEEPVIKITSKVSVARKMIADRYSNRCIGMMIFGDEIIRRSESEIPDLLTRKQLDYFSLNTSINVDSAKRYIDYDSNMKLFACTKDFLLENWEPEEQLGVLTSTISEQADILIDRILEKKTINNGITWDEYKKFKRIMQIIRLDDAVSDDKDNFIVQGYSLFNLLLSAVFPIKDLDYVADSGIIGVASTESKLGIIKDSIPSLPAHLQEMANDCFLLLRNIRERELDVTEKEKVIRKILSKNRTKKVLLVVPKAYYRLVIEEAGITRYMLAIGRLDIVTPNKVNPNKKYDVVVVVGDLSSDRFNIYSCAYSKDILLVLYGCEDKKFRLTEKKHLEKVKLINEMSYIPVETEDYLDEEIEENVVEVKEIQEIDSDLDSFMQSISDQTYIAALNRFGETSSHNSNMLSDVVAMGYFETGEHAVFTKNYKAYVLDENKGVVKEVDIQNVQEGDLIIFTENNELTHDIVDRILSLEVESPKAPEIIKESYRLSKQWRQELVEYRDRENLKSVEVAQRMKIIGANVVIATIVKWMDEDSHLVGPMKIESLSQIGKLVGNSELENNPQKYFEACQIIRRERGRILKEIGRQIIKNYTDDNSKATFDGIDIDISELSLILRVEQIHPIENKIPTYLTNHPISI